MSVRCEKENKSAGGAAEAVVEYRWQKGWKVERSTGCRARALTEKARNAQ